MKRLRRELRSLVPRIKAALRRRGLLSPVREPEGAAHPGTDRAPEHHEGRSALKEMYTSHWDLDMLPREEVEKLMKESKKSNEE